MITAIKNLTNKTNTSASVVDGKLILSFPDAQTPVLWQMDLTQAKASAIEVLKADKGDTFSLTLKTQKGEKVQVASFDSREQALEGLMAASRALENAHGNIQIAANEDQKVAVSHAPRKKASKSQWVTGLVALFALIVLFGFWASVSPKSPTSIQSASGNIASQTAAPTAQSSGVPVSADDFLNSL